MEFVSSVTENHQLPKHFSYTPSIDGLRFFAFLFVFLGHIPFTFFTEVSKKTAWYGVEFFFLLSGFLLTRLLVTEYRTNTKISIKKYFIRRVLRIWPLYYSYLLLTVLLSIVRLHINPDMNRLAGNVFFVDNILSAFNGHNSNLSTSHLWSISLEEQYYFALPFFLIWLVKQTHKTVALTLLSLFILLTAGKILAIVLQFKHPFIYALPISGESFVLGCIMGLGIYNEALKKINSWMLFVVGLFLLCIVYFLPSVQVFGVNQFFSYLLVAIAFGLILFAVSLNENKILQSVFENRVIVYLGKISFGLYIFHRLVIDKFIPLMKRSDPLLRSGIVILIFVLTVAIAILSYEFFEKRFLKLKERFSVVKNNEV